MNDYIDIINCASITGYGLPDLSPSRLPNTVTIMYLFYPTANQHVSDSRITFPPPAPYSIGHDIMRRVIIHFSHLNH
jgi:hypothetical protein